MRLAEKMTSVEGWCAGCDAMTEAELTGDLLKIGVPDFFDQVRVVRELACQSHSSAIRTARR